MADGFRRHEYTAEDFLPRDEWGRRIWPDEAGNDPRANADPDNRRPRPNSMPPRFLSTAEFLARFEPKDFILKPILEEGRLYTLTGPTGTGKTAIALLMALHVGFLGTPLGVCKVRRAGVIFLAGENPDDVRTRWLTMLRRLHLNPKDADVRFVEGRFSIGEQYDVVARELAARPAGLVTPDTLQALFSGDDSNSNDQMKEAAEIFRGIARLGPAVMIPAHPVKGATRERNVLYGGGALLNEVDGNLSLWGPPDAVTLSWCGKFRGAFEPMTFAIEPGVVPDETDSDGDPIKTVTARILASDEAEAVEAATNRGLQRLLAAIAENPGASIQRLADACAPTVGMAGWSKTNTFRRLHDLARDGLAEVHLGQWTLTMAGKRTVENA
jgi:hypothetical protein